MKTEYYDIESLLNIFTLCNLKDDESLIDAFYLCDDDSLTKYAPNPDLTEQVLTDYVCKVNDNYKGIVKLHNLKERESCDLLAKTFGLSDAGVTVNMPDAHNSYAVYSDAFRPVCDTDTNYDPDIHPYLGGYNSYNYDTTMLALFFYETYGFRQQGMEQIPVFQPPTAKLMREHNDNLFTPAFKESMPTYLTRVYNNKRWSDSNYQDQRWKIRKSMLMSGRHIDIARFNEKQQKLGLKRICGMLGFQIKESDKLKGNDCEIKSFEDFCELLAYNISDIVNLRRVAEHKTYKSQFKLKKRLLQTYPELIYERIPGEYKPDIRPEAVRRDRLTVDCSSARFAATALCPYDHLTDIETVSFMYPSEAKAKEYGIPRVNVLEETKKFFYRNFSQPEVRAGFDRVYNYYKSIEGKNFNSSDEYKSSYHIEGAENPKTWTIGEIPSTNLCLPYFDKDGKPTSCFVTFSIGGIHGAEYNKALFDYDCRVHKKLTADFEYVKSLYPDPIDLKKAKTVTLKDGTVEKASKFLASGSTLKKAAYKTLPDAPVLFEAKNKKTKKNETIKGSYAIKNKYVFTSGDLTNHEDFTSYYPNMLRMLDAFYNTGLGYDRYAEIFDDKQKYGVLMKDKAKYSEEERDDFALLREGTKLILNSASGAADAAYYTPIRMNNMIISMRIIGQLFTYRIGQAQTIHGARVTSTNTDGLFTVLEATKNNKILEKESADIHVEIEPEPIFLISKDTNNRLEMDDETGNIVNESGGTLGCRKGPNPAKALAHPAILDWALAEYLITACVKPVAPDGTKRDLSQPFHDVTGMNILKSAIDRFKPVDVLLMFQHIVSSSIGSVNYIFGMRDGDENPIIMQHYNRIFIMKDDTPNTIHLWSANAKKLSPATKLKRQRTNEAMQQHDPLAISILGLNGVKLSDIPNDKEAVIKKVTNIDNSWNILILNRNLHTMTDDVINYIIDNLDFDKYLELLRHIYDESWRNEVPEMGFDESVKLAANPVMDIAIKDDNDVLTRKSIADIDIINQVISTVSS